jgi:hypothetical protein
MRASRSSSCQFNDAKYDRWLSRIELKIDGLVAQLARVAAGVTSEGATLMTVQDDVNNLVSAVSAETTIVSSVQTLLDELTTLINNLKGQVTDPATVAALEQAVTQLQANNAAIAAAVTANTPAA